MCEQCFRVINNTRYALMKGCCNCSSERLNYTGCAWCSYFRDFSTISFGIIYRHNQKHWLVAVILRIPLWRYSVWQCSCFKWGSDLILGEFDCLLFIKSLLFHLHIEEVCQHVSRYVFTKAVKEVAFQLPTYLNEKTVGYSAITDHY